VTRSAHEMRTVCSLEQCDACLLGVRPVDHPVWSVSAAPEHHSRHHVIVRPGQDYAVPGWTYAAPRPPLHYDDTPSYNDPSKLAAARLAGDTLRLRARRPASSLPGRTDEVDRLTASCTIQTPLWISAFRQLVL
jgi:hypothetical protein